MAEKSLHRTNQDLVFLSFVGVLLGGSAEGPSHLSWPQSLPHQSDTEPRHCTRVGSASNGLQEAGTFSGQRMRPTPLLLYNVDLL